MGNDEKVITVSSIKIERKNGIDEEMRDSVNCKEIRIYIYIYIYAYLNSKILTAFQ
jgi:hypothetical protein